MRLKATAETEPYDAKFLEEERLALGEAAFKREYLGIPTGGDGNPFTWELFERVIHRHQPLFPPGPEFRPEPASAAIPMPNPFHQLKQKGLFT